MKTARDVRNYMRQQEWFSSWRTFLLDSELPPRSIIRLLMGKNVSAMMSFFDWKKTVQGYKYWERVAADFKKWYRDEE